MKRMVKAAVLFEVNQGLQVIDVQQSPPKAGEVLVRMGAAGICRSDHHFMVGTAPIALPCVLGHEGAGVVEEVGEGVTNVKPGDRCVLSFVSSCGYCRSCQAGAPNICDTNLSTGVKQYDGTVRLTHGEHEINQMGKLGVFAEKIVCPAQACFHIPDELSIEVAALIGCSVTTGTGAVLNNGATPGMTVAVFGCGGVGLNAIQGARLVNAKKIIAVDIADHKLEFAYRFGATDTINALNSDAVGAIREIVGDGVDMAVEAFGSATTCSQAYEATRKGGTTVICGIAQFGDTVPIDMVSLVRQQKTLVGSYYGSGSSLIAFPKLIDFYLKGLLDIDGLIVRRFSLSQINEAYEALERGEDGRGLITSFRG